MTKTEQHKNTIQRFRECINNNDKALAEELIAPRRRICQPDISRQTLRRSRLSLCCGVHAQEFF